MKIIKSNSVNFSKFCNFDETEENKPQISDDHNPGEDIDNIIGKSESESEEPVAEQSTTTPQDEFLQQQEIEAERKAIQAQLQKDERNQAHQDRVNDLASANETLGLTREDLNSRDQLAAARGQEVADQYTKMEERGKVGDFVDEGASKVLGIGKGAASALGGLLNKFDTTKNVGNKLKNKADGFDSEYAGMKAGNWADEHKVAAGAIGAGALLGAGILAKKGYDLMKGKKELQANAYYAFDDGDINKGSLIGGPYSTRKDAREAHPEAAHILKGSTLGAYGDFEVAS